MVKARRDNPMEMCSMATSNLVRKRAKGNTFGVVRLNRKEIIKTTLWTGRGYCSGQPPNAGRKANCTTTCAMALERLAGLMAHATKGVS